MPVLTKTCSRCKKTLPITEFHRATKGTYGVGGYCKLCQDIRQKEWRKKRRTNVPEPAKPNKVCSNCNKDLPISEFYVGIYGSGGKQSSCKSCQKKKSRAWRRDNPDQARVVAKTWELNNKRRRKDLTLRRDHGIGLEEYEALFSKQKGVCAICKQLLIGSKGHLDVDHDHTTGKIRGLLCNSCNRGIGFLKDCPTTLRSAADYLESCQAVFGS